MQMLKYVAQTFIILLSVSTTFAQKFEPENGVASSTTTYALTNARIVVSPDETIERGTLVIKDGKIEAVGLAVIPPKNAVKIDVKGYTLYPSFIEPCATEGLKDVEYKSTNNQPQLSTLKSGPYYWNQAIHPERDAYQLFDFDSFSQKKDYLAAGFGAVSTHSKDGILRGTSVLFTLGNDEFGQEVIRSQAANHYSFSKGKSKQTYPSSQMGAIALIKQFFADAIWFDEFGESTDNISFTRGLKNLELPQIFSVTNKLEALRAVKLASLLPMENRLIVKGGGDEYERAAAIKASGVELIIPVNFPDPFDVTDPYLSRFVSLADLKDWELKPANASILHHHQIPFSFSTDGLKKKEDFLANIRKAINCGLPKSVALHALTVQPANYLRVSDQLGTLEEGKLANFLVVKGDLFEEDGEIFENWVRGNRNTIKDIEAVDMRGTYGLNVNAVVYQLKITGKLDAPKVDLDSYQWKTDSTTGARKMDTVSLQPNFKQNGLQVSLNFSEDKGNFDGVVQLNGSYNPKLGVFHGKALLPNGEWADWSAIRSEKYYPKKKKQNTIVDTAFSQKIKYPNMAYGFDTLPEPETIYIKNATIWTNEKEGILKNATLLIVDGKIKAVNESVLTIPNDAVIIDAEGKHVTSGIIDEHSHIAISKGVNESGQSITAEVSISDVVRSNDINIYRQLAGGVTASQLLHGSANPIGGQSALIKLKWGFAPEQMLINDAPGFIKFALGENVKQSNWGDHNTIRFPQTRMGVEQVFYDAFIRAKEYKAAQTAYDELSEKKREGIVPPRKDFELEILAEILDHKRFVTCHSYIQSEINMLMRVADSMGFTLNTFTHILEGYKVAKKMKAHGAGASTFADWWAYKFEVNEAIPYNAAILHQMGIVTAINSDDAEMGRRLNQEAAKVVKYGGVSEEEAWKMVTLNPAKLLHLDDRMGSIKVGKDADIVIWSSHPLSIQAKVEKTIIDGIIFYDLDKSVQLHKRDLKERNRIMKLMLAAKQSGAKTKKPYKKLNPHYHCDTVEE